MAPGRFASQLVRWFGKNARDLPWRRNRTPWRIWVSEIMLQQTQVATVIPYFRRFIRRFPSVRKLSTAPLDDIMKQWEGLGYYARARNLHRAACMVVQNGKGRFPRTASQWNELPGIGSYTAAAIASLARGERVPVVDGNVRRVVSRYLASDGEPERFLCEAIRKVDPARFNEGIMELGQLICRVRNPDCASCPVNGGCLARRKGTPDRFPAGKPPRKIPHHPVAVAICRKGGRLLVARRREKGMLGGMWELPGGKIRKNEPPANAVIRELKEETGLKAEAVGRVADVRHQYTHFSVRLIGYECRWIEGDPRPLASTAVRWIAPKDLATLAFPTGTRRVLEAAGLL